MKLKLFFLMSVLTTGAACTREPRLYNILEAANGEVSSVLKLTSDSTEVYLTDYFPALEGVDSVTSPTLDITPNVPTWERFAVRITPDTRWLNHVEVWQGGVSVSIVAENRTRRFDPQQAPFIVSEGYRRHEVSILADEGIRQIFVLWQNVMLPKEFVKRTPHGFDILIPAAAERYDRSYLRAYAANEAGISNDLIVPLSKRVPVNHISQLTRHDKHTFILYSLMIDRFYNGNPDNDRKLNRPDVLDKVDYQGGDLAGVTQKIREGFFNDLGVNTIWLSPITQNPDDAWGLNREPYTKFSGYHGYWPVYVTVVDGRFGTEDELRELLDEAHKHDLNVILDYVSNHLHIDSPTLKAHPDWITELYLPDGRRNLELWDEYRLTTWFDQHIPSLDLERAEVADPMSDSALYWIDNFDFDGFRHDATKHIPLSYWRMLTRKLKIRHPQRTVYQIGETYGSPELIASYVKEGMLDGQFDFNVYDAAVWALAGHDGSFKNLASALQESLDTYGYHNEMGYITGNHDRPRFISLAGEALRFDEDSKAAGWKREIGVGDSSGYDKLALLEAFIFTIPGIPCVYQGDEYGVPGANDPDNRRMMQFGSYRPKEQELLDKVKKLIALRKNSLPLIYGDLIQLQADEDVLVYARVYMGTVNVVALNKSRHARQLQVEVPFDGLYLANLRGNFGNSATVRKDGITFLLPPLSFEVLTPKNK